MLRQSFGKKSLSFFQKAKRNKYNAVRVQIDGIWFDSKMEGSYYHVLKTRQSANQISEIKIHPRYPIEINGIKVCDVELDFEYYDNLAGKLCYDDVKGKDTDISRLKRKLLEAHKGIKVQLVRGR